VAQEWVSRLETKTRIHDKERRLGDIRAKFMCKYNIEINLTVFIYSLDEFNFSSISLYKEATT